MRKASFKKYQLRFKSPVLTSRGEMKVKNGYFLFVFEGDKTGIGECSFIEGLSRDNLEEYEKALQLVCKQIENGTPQYFDLSAYPSIQFGYECAMLDLKNDGRKILLESEFTRGEKRIPVNGLVWMGNQEFMLQQIEQKLVAGFTCIKIKVGAIDFKDEVALLKFIRKKFPPDVIEIRLDANGAFGHFGILEKLDALSKFHIHSIEQPVRAGQINLMKKICSSSPIPVALDEELIPLFLSDNKENLLREIKPQYIILKPSILGGFEICHEWIELAKKYTIGWWVTSALESNIGLNAIAQWVFTKNSPLVQGLGTGGLYTNNISSPLYIKDGQLCYNPDIIWGDIMCP